MRKIIRYAALSAAAGLVVGLLASGESFVLQILAQVLIFGIAALGLNILTGMGGQVSIGNAAFMSIGAYTSVILVTRLGLPLPLAALGGAMLAALFGLAIGFPALRMKGFYLAVATMAFGVVIEQLIKVIPALGAHNGLRNIPRLLANDFANYLFILVCYVALVMIARIVAESPVGLRWRMVRDGETAARSFGVNVQRAKLSAFMMSAAYGGIAGALYADTVGFISSADFGLARSLDLLAMVMIGGLGSYHGGLGGAAIIVGLRFVFSRGFGPWLTVIIGGLLIVFTLFFPRGIAWGLTLAWHRHLQRPYLALRRAMVRRKPAGGQTVQAGGRTIHYRVKGSGPQPVLCIHGNLGSSRWWDGLPDSDRYRFIAPDLPGFGRSEALAAADIGAYADAMLDLFDALRLERPALVGHSLGGAVVLAMLARRPDLARAAVLVDSCPPDGLQTPEDHYPVIETYKTSYAILRNSLAAIAPELKHRPTLAGLVDEALLMSLDYYAGNARSLQAFRYAPAAAFGRPVLVLRGRKDIIITGTMARKTVAAFPQGQYREFENCGHSPMAEIPGEFNAALLAFLDGL
ncbi:MAG: hypothetical protein A2087_12415 [Spirochaetes bacterium GWD1_61_31]|nr:MAG: hypothetical protein A2Y37_06310 [Spirochaetes bacterium GWB1_60_80]OHD33598.1 MAG: hypothetical protein A2004_06505 [Spirochaetes bacterium GWC1_61_12]OHD38521.1 MAG: hypothetical protein A2087_12415 [Spirochaetes bacterium GWD1_61_31]OHD43039.1 MAG: hypothetical protein A2Y35_01300 [Spirochaetes bacterium GWE1_60_18]OHD59634.1 MAG: hypothetical protein A2Y32_12180 [Spirochaetes bacterium GWF1_60_12]HAP43834.1 hypothetical protein [Spirochaetaceae bacterium]